MRFLTFLILCGSTSVWATGAIQVGGGSGSGTTVNPKSGDMWFTVGVGSRTVSAPVHSVDFDSTALVTAGVEIPVVRHLAFTLGAIGMISGGNMQYDYTDSNNVHYTSSKTSITTSEAGLMAGLQLRLVDLSFFHVFVEGGGFISGVTFNYDIPATDKAVFTASNYQKSQTNLVVSGTYEEAGIDLVFPSAYGVRFAVRLANSSCGAVDALANQKMKMSEVEGMAGVTKVLF